MSPASDTKCIGRSNQFGIKTNSAMKTSATIKTPKLKNGVKKNKYIKNVSTSCTTMKLIVFIAIDMKYNVAISSSSAV